MRRLIYYIIILFLSLPLAGQEITISADYPSVVESGQQFSVTWSINSGDGKFEAPPFTGFYKLMGPQTSYNSSTQIINGKMSHEVSYRYVYYLQADEEGTYVIPPATYTVKNDTYSSDSLFIEVISSSQAGGNRSGTGDGTEELSDVASSGENIFVDLSLNRREVFLGEYIVATVKIYTRVDISGINEIKLPSFNSFLKTDLETPPLTSLKQENVNGTIYGSGVVQQFLLYPQVEGEIVIDPVQMNILVRQRTGETDPFFGDFFSSYQTVPMAVTSQAIKINVKPLPGVQPENFSGVAGNLDIQAEINKDTVTVNDAVNLKITVSGSGNLKIASAPHIDFPPDLEVYDPEISDKLRNSIQGTSGEKSFEYLIIPRHYGEFTIPPVSYSYFNTSTGSYKDLTTGEFKFYALQSDDQGSGITVYGGISQEDVKYLGKDIRFIRSDPGNLSESGEIILTRPYYYSTFLFSLFIFLIVLFLRREHIRRNADTSAVKNRKAGKVAGKRLKRASACLKSEEIDKFYEEILKAMWGYLSDKLNIPVADLTRNNAVASMKEKGRDEDLIQRLTDILDRCEYARYAPSASTAKAADIYKEASHFIKSMENATG